MGQGQGQGRGLREAAKAGLLHPGWLDHPSIHSSVGVCACLGCKEEKTYHNHMSPDLKCRMPDPWVWLKLP